MNAKLWACIVCAVLIAHLALIFIIDHARKLGQPPRPRMPNPNFGTTTYHYVDEQGVEIMQERHYRVTTKFADKEKLPNTPNPSVQN